MKEELLKIIDEYAESYHVAGHWTYNIKTCELRKKLIAELEKYSTMLTNQGWALENAERTLLAEQRSW